MLGLIIEVKFWHFCYFSKKTIDFYEKTAITPVNNQYFFVF